MSNYQGKRAIGDALLDGAAAGLWLVLAWGFTRRGEVLDLALAGENALIAALFLARRPPVRRGTALDLALAGAATIWPLVGLRPADGRGAKEVALLLELAALAWIGAGLWSLGRSFGVAPADRGVVTRGLYRWVRHPLYTGEVAFVAAYGLGNPTWGNLGVLAVLAMAQAVRARREERLLAGNPTYRQYGRRVPWRFVPGVW